MALEITDQNFDQLTAEAGKLTVVDFWAEWCGPCRMVGPIVDELSKTYAEQANIGKVNVDFNPEVAGRFGIRNIPTILFIKDGQVVDRQVGAAPRPVLEDKVKKWM